MSTNKTALITASYSGIGSQIAEQLAADGYALVLLNRDAAKTRQQVVELSKQFPAVEIKTVFADLADEEALKSAAIKIAREHSSIELAFLNAGWIGINFTQSPQNNDMNLQVNVLANHVLLQLLRPSLARGSAKVIASGSGARRMVKNTDLIHVLNVKRQTGIGAYAQSKQTLVDMFAAMGPDFSSDGVTLKVVDLPPTKTEMAKNKAVPSGMRLFAFLFATPKKAAAKLIRASTSTSQSANAPTNEQMELLSEIEKLTGL